ncbi:DUF3611 family protein [Methylocystis sp. WRRC1]|uniref:DUF3611 family protein n=1 Tax=Methylocystis sp. WRRC1 TaxID=1732014 RepID=UPI001D135744|nr:DUF3611 family protein [Methylocystis sp. WRRC1]MCC3243890.1 DUF3611 family protein [Methylocystis sp. WRRC1]
MDSNPRRNIAAIALFWIFLVLCVGVLGVGWSLNNLPAEDQTRVYLADLHVSLGLSAAILLLAQFLLGAALLLAGAFEIRSGRQTVALWLRRLIYVAFLALAISGALALAYRGEQIFFWAYPLPYWNGGDRLLADLLKTIHGYAAYALAGLIIAYVAFTLFDRFAPAAPADSRAVEVPAPTTIAAMIADGLSHSFGFFGATAFWLQLLLGVVSAVLLVFGYVGHTVSPDASGFGDAIYWATAAIGLLALTTIFSFYYMKTAARIRNRPEHYLSHQRGMSFWFVGSGGFINVLGALASFVGVGLSVALLIGKTVSQPPGIAITDPVKIIRALDVFVLLVNFSLLFAHFVGLGVAAWLMISALKSRHQYVVATEAGK